MVNGEIKRNVFTKKRITIASAVGFIIFVAAAITASKTIYKAVIEPPLERKIIQVHNDQSKGDRGKMDRLMIQGIRTQAYIEMMINDPNVRNVAESRARRDSANYVRGLADGR